VIIATIIAAEFAVGGVMMGAVVSHLAVGDPTVTLVTPIIFICLVTASWALRLLARHDDIARACRADARARRVVESWAGHLMLQEEHRWKGT